MADIMDQRSDEHGRTPVAGLGVFVRDPSEVAKGLLGQVDDAQAVSEPVVIGSGVGQVADAKLVDATEALHLGAVEQVDQPPVLLGVDADVVVERVTDNLRGHACPRSCDDTTSQIVGSLHDRAGVR